MTELFPRRRSEFSLLKSGEASKRLKMITGFYGVLAGVYAGGLTVMVAAAFVASGTNVATLIPRPAQAVYAAVSFVSILQTYHCCETGAGVARLRRQFEEFLASPTRYSATA